MGKRSNFDRVPRDYYPTPLEAVLPLLKHLPEDVLFAEPCAGDGRLITHIETHSTARAYLMTDIEPRIDYVGECDVFDLEIQGCDMAITNPPWNRNILHPLIVHLSNQVPTWLLFDADWIHTKQSADFGTRLTKIVSVGRVKWIEGSKHKGKDNACWYLFDKPDPERVCQFFGQ